MFERLRRFFVGVASEARVGRLSCFLLTATTLFSIATICKSHTSACQGDGKSECRDARSPCCH